MKNTYIQLQSVVTFAIPPDESVELTVLDRRTRLQAVSILGYFNVSFE